MTNNISIQFNLQTVHSAGDADILIVQTDVRLSEKKNSIVVMADDTGILVLFLYHLEEELGELFLQTRAGKQTKTCWNIREIANQLSTSLKSNLLFVHAWTGCDTTSAVHQKGNYIM